MFVRRTPGILALFIILGGLIGDLIGEVLRRILPPSPVKDLFLHHITFGFSPFTIDIALLKFTLGITFNFNLLAVIFIFVMVFILTKL